MKIKDIQQQLASRGYTPGPIDGVWGRSTVAAVRQFQTTHGLTADGVVGPLTLAALFKDAATPLESIPTILTGFDDPTLVWFQEARRLLGVKEEPGVRNNPKILQWATVQGLKEYDADSTPWCGLFVGHCVSATLDREPTPTELLSARSWARFGIPSAPTIGAVMVFWRGSPTGWQGHVGFYAGESQDAYRVLGGNQSDSVSLAWLPKQRLVTSRWPATVPPRPANTITVANNASLSWNEA